MIASKPKSAYAARKDGDWYALLEEIAALPSLAACEAWWTAFVVERLSSGPDWQDELLEALTERKSVLRAEAQMRHMDQQFLNAMERD